MDKWIETRFKKIESAIFCQDKTFESALRSPHVFLTTFLRNIPAIAIQRQGKKLERAMDF